MHQINRFCIVIWDFGLLRLCLENYGDCLMRLLWIDHDFGPMNVRQSAYANRYFHTVPWCAVRRYKSACCSSQFLTPTARAWEMVKTLHSIVDNTHLSISLVYFSLYYIHYSAAILSKVPILARNGQERCASWGTKWINDRINYKFLVD